MVVMVDPFQLPRAKRRGPGVASAGNGRLRRHFLPIALLFLSACAPRMEVRVQNQSDTPMRVDMLCGDEAFTGLTVSPRGDRRLVSTANSCHLNVSAPAFVACHCLDLHGCGFGVGRAEWRRLRPGEAVEFDALPERLPASPGSAAAAAVRPETRGTTTP